MLAVLLSVGWGSAHADRLTYCCFDESGQRVCGDSLPRQCFQRGYWVVNERGITVRRVDPPLSADQRAQREAEARRKQEQERLLKEQQRRDRALLDAYASEKDIDLLRDRVLKDLESNIKSEQEFQAIALKRKKELDEEMEFYRKSPPPKELTDAIQENESILRAHASVIQAKQKEMDAVRAKYDDEKRRYADLQRRMAEQGRK